MKKRPFSIDELFHSLPPSTENASEALQSKLIDAFESAIFQGMSPCDALALILQWASSELNRIGVSLASEPDKSGGVQASR